MDASQMEINDFQERCGVGSGKNEEKSAIASSVLLHRKSKPTYSPPHIRVNTYRRIEEFEEQRDLDLFGEGRVEELG
jgi:hypothetical protein